MSLPFTIIIYQHYDYDDHQLRGSISKGNVFEYTYGTPVHLRIIRKITKFNFVIANFYSPEWHHGYSF